MSAGHELFEHTADVGVHAWGDSREQVFEQAGLAVMALICDPATVERREQIAVELEQPTDELLLAAWLNELIFLCEARRYVFAGFSVEQAGGGRLRAGALGERVDTTRHRVHPGVKAATLHELTLAPSEHGWEGRVILDV